MLEGEAKVQGSTLLLITALILLAATSVWLAVAQVKVQRRQRALRESLKGAEEAYRVHRKQLDEANERLRLELETDNEFVSEFIAEVRDLERDTALRADSLGTSLATADAPDSSGEGSEPSYRVALRSGHTPLAESTARAVVVYTRAFGKQLEFYRRYAFAAGAWEDVEVHVRDVEMQDPVGYWGAMELQAELCSDPQFECPPFASWRKSQSEGHPLQVLLRSALGNVDNPTDAVRVQGAGRQPA